MIKYFIGLYRKDGRGFAEQMFRTGGMPSAHSGGMIALSLSVWLLEGWSNLFFACAVISVLIIRDSFGVRWSVGQQAKTINKIITHEHMHEKVKVVMGHTVIQTSMGIVLGAVVAVLVYFLTL